MTYQKNKNIGSRYLVEESPCKISGPKLFPVFQNLGASHAGPLGLSTGDSRSADDKTRAPKTPQKATFGHGWWKWNLR